MANPVNEIRRRVTSGQTAAQLERQPAQLHLAEAGGMLWASNRQWLTPAVRVAPLLEQYNLPAGEPGHFEVNGTVRAVGGERITSTATILDLAQYPVPAAPVQLGGRPAHVPTADGKAMAAVYQTADGTLMTLPPEDVAWLSAVTLNYRPRAFELADGEHFGPVRVMTKGNGNAPVLLVADVIRTITPGSYGPDPDTGRSVWTDAVTENLGPRAIGALMAAKLEG